MNACELFPLFESFPFNSYDFYIRFPAWAEELIVDGSLFHKIAMLDFSFYGKTPKMARIRPGFLLKEMLERFSKKSTNKLNPREQALYLYSAHDVTVCIDY